MNRIITVKIIEWELPHAYNYSNLFHFKLPNKEDFKIGWGFHQIPNEDHILDQAVPYLEEASEEYYYE